MGAHSMNVQAQTMNRLSAALMKHTHDAPLSQTYASPPFV